MGPWPTERFWDTLSDRTAPNGAVRGAALNAVSQQLVILARAESMDDGLPPLGSRDEILEKLAGLNTAPAQAGEDVLYGPGIRIELPPGDPVSQMLMTVVEEEIAWQVIMRLAKDMQWKLRDMATGREWSP